MSTSEKSLQMDIRVKLPEARAAFSIDALIFEGQRRKCVER
jgi:hypothetical protein